MDGVVGEMAKPGGGKGVGGREGKCERERGEWSFGFVVNRCKWVKAGPE